MIDALLGGPAPQRSFPAAPLGSVCSLPFSCFALLPSRSRHRRTPVPRPYRPWPRGRPSPSIRRRRMRSPDGYAVGTNNDFDTALRKVRPDSAERGDGVRVRCSVIATSGKIMSASIERFAKPLRAPGYAAATSTRVLVAAKVARLCRARLLACSRFESDGRMPGFAN